MWKENPTLGCMLEFVPLRISVPSMVRPRPCRPIPNGSLGGSRASNSFAHHAPLRCQISSNIMDLHLHIHSHQFLPLTLEQ
jgi:hypothetical protein